MRQRRGGRRRRRGPPLQLELLEFAVGVVEAVGDVVVQQRRRRHTTAEGWGGGELRSKSNFMKPGTCLLFVPIPIHSLFGLSVQSPSLEEKIFFFGSKNRSDHLWIGLEGPQREKQWSRRGVRLMGAEGANPEKEGVILFHWT